MIIAYSVIAVLFFVTGMVITFRMNRKTSLKAKIIVSLIVAVVWPILLLVSYLLDLKDFLIYLWRKLKK